MTKFDLDNYDRERWIIDYTKILDIDNLPGEKWKNFGEVFNIDYTNTYNSSNFGRVKSLDRYVTKNGKRVFIKGKILRQIKAPDTGYYQVNLFKNKKRRTVRTHTLVARAFCKNDDPENKSCVNHKDEIKINNRWDNLEWCTIGYNMNYGTARKRQSETLKQRYANEEIKSHNKRQIVQLSLSGDFISKYDSIADATKNGFSSSNIIGCCSHKKRKHGGYIWMYESEYTEEAVKECVESLSLYANRKPVVQLTLDGEYIKTWPSATSLKSIGYNGTNISRCCNHKLKTAYGYKWEYESEYKNLLR